MVCVLWHFADVLTLTLCVLCVCCVCTVCVCAVCVCAVCVYCLCVCRVQAAARALILKGKVASRQQAAAALGDAVMQLLSTGAAGVGSGQVSTAQVVGR